MTKNTKNTFKIGKIKFIFQNSYNGRVLIAINRYGVITKVKKRIFLKEGGFPLGEYFQHKDIGLCDVVSDSEMICIRNADWEWRKRRAADVVDTPFNESEISDSKYLLALCKKGYIKLLPTDGNAHTSGKLYCNGFSFQAIRPLPNKNEVENAPTFQSMFSSKMLDMIFS